jgi:hypothetical protein
MEVSMRRAILVLAAVVACGVVCGCAGTLPTNSYIPQNYARYDHGNIVDMGVFTYAPMSDEKRPVKSNQIQNTAAGSIYISTDVADMVKRATALELEKTGLVLKDLADIVISGDVLELKADDLGYSVHWTYVVRYKISNKASGNPLYAREYRPEMKKTGKFGMPSDYSSVVHEMVLSGYDMFIRDQKVRDLLDVPVAASAETKADKKESAKKK